MDKDRRKLLQLLAASPLLPGTVASVLAACGGKTSNASASGPGEPAKPFGGAKPSELPWKDKFRYLDLMDNLSFASLRNQGLVIDFGTTDYFKYTLGGWRTGWGRSLVRDGVAYTHAVGVSARVYFNWDVSQDLTVRFRAKRLGGNFFSLYFNNKDVEKVTLTSADWATYSVDVPARLVRAGENYMLLRWDKTEPAAGENVAAAVDTINILSAGAAEREVPAKAAERDAVLPTQASIVSEVRSGDEQAAALSLSSGMGLSYWLEVPQRAALLGLTAGMIAGRSRSAVPDMNLRATATTDGHEPVELLSQTFKGSEAGRFTPLAVDLSKAAGQVVRLDLAVSSPTATEARLALVGPSLYTEPPAVRGTQVTTKAKNAVVVMIDTLRADHTAPYAKTRVKAPVFEALAARGVLFQRFSAVEDWTKPSCATMLTGLYPDTHKTQTEGVKLPSAIGMISEEMRKRGVKTGAFVANGYVSGKFGFKRGWDKYVNYIREGKTTDAEHVFADAASWIETVKDQRFYAYIHTIDPHVPYSPPEEFLKMYDDQPYAGPVQPRKTAQHLEDIKKGKFSPTKRDKERILALYDGEISYHDKWFGTFLDRLKQMGILERTLIMIVSDHGEEFWEHGSVGHGHQLHQELIHVPFVMVWPGTIPPKSKVSDNCDHGCMVPTTFEAMGLPAPDYLEGRSVLRTALGNPEPGPHAGFSTHQGDRQAVWAGRWKLLMRGPVKTHLYDVEEDPGCQQNLAKRRPIALAYMRALLGQFQGAPDKPTWRSRKMGERKRVEATQEKVKMDNELQEQLKALGYFH